MGNQNSIRRTKKQLRTKTYKPRLFSLGKYGKKRIYFNDNQLAKVFGLVVARYKSGAIKNAELNGEKISNSKAGKIIANNPYFDCLSNSFVSADLNPII